MFTGMALAMAEAQLLVATLAQRFRPELVPGRHIAIEHGITLQPRGRIKMTLVPRHPGQSSKFFAF